jgi:hypothetical protein
MARSQGSTQKNDQRARKSGGETQTQPKVAAGSPDQDTDVEEDEVFGLVSVLYHALQGASASRKYIRDAQAASDDELKEFFERCRADDAARASEAKRLLVLRVDEEDAEGGDADEDDEEDDDDDDDEDDEET